MEPTGPHSDSRSAASETKLTPAQELVSQLRSSFVDQLQRALGVELPAEESALAYIDHHLSELREEDREPIITLVASGAGAWFGEFVRERVGGHWIGDGKDPRRLRLLIEPAFLHFSPVDLAYEAIFGRDVDADDPRAPEGVLIDGSYQLDKRSNPPQDASDVPENHDTTSDQEWISARLSELSPVPADQYFSMTGRFETLELILEMLAHRRVAEGKSPKMLSVNDYVHALAG